MRWVKTSATRGGYAAAASASPARGAPPRAAPATTVARRPPPVRPRTRVALLRAMDRAIEFATLGEYGLEVPGADDVLAPGTGRSAHSVARRPGAIASPGRLPRRVQPATPAGRPAPGEARPAPARVAA